MSTTRVQVLLNEEEETLLSYKAGRMRYSLTKFVHLLISQEVYTIVSLPNFEKILDDIQKQQLKKEKFKKMAKNESDLLD